MSRDRDDTRAHLMRAAIRAVAPGLDERRDELTPDQARLAREVLDRMVRELGPEGGAEQTGAGVGSHQGRELG